MVSAATIMLDLKEGEAGNSNLVVAPKGSGKGTFLEAILAKANPEVVWCLPQKAFESKLVHQDRSVFMNRIHVAEDLLPTLEAASKIQRHQLLALYTQLLQSGRYTRDDLGGLNTITGARIIAFFGVAAEEWHRYAGEFSGSTFLERVVPIYLQLTDEQEHQISLNIAKRRGSATRESTLPRIRLPEGGQGRTMVLPENLQAAVVARAKKLSKYTGLSIARATHYVTNFLLASALWNGRSEPSVWDLLLYKHVEDLHFPPPGKKPMEQVRWAVRMATDAMTIQQLVVCTHLSDKQVRHSLNGLAEEGEVEVVRVGEHGEQLWGLPP